MTDREWLDAQQRQHNLASFTWREVRPRRRRYVFTEVQLRIAVECESRREGEAA